MPAATEVLATAVACVERGEFDAAEEISRSVLRFEPRCARALHVLGVVARRTGRLQLAIAVLRDAVQCDPNEAGIRCELGLALSDADREEEAVVHYRRAVEINPTYGDACLNLAAALDRLEQPEAALPWARRATELLPAHAIARFNFGNIWRVLGELERAAAEFQVAIDLDPSFASAHWNNACCRLLAGDFARGWPEYEWREAAGEVQCDHYPQPRWQGESLAGQTILVHAEQGIGDEILFASCLPELIALSGQCVVVCEPRLEKLFARSFPQAAVHGIARRKDRVGALLAEKIDKQIPAGSLPLYLRPSRDSFPDRRQFLTAAPELRCEWRERLKTLGPGLKVGISWRAGGQPSERRKRTTDLERWRGIFALPGVQFVNLQYGECGGEIAAARREMGVVIHDLPNADPLGDLDGFAAKVAALDLVISVGNATVHLAGALGVPTWALLPKVPGWRWMIAGEHSLWYPSVRLIRQSERREWQPAFAEAARALAAMVGTASDEPLSLAAIRSAAPRERGMGSVDDANHSEAITPTIHFDAAAILAAALESFAHGDAAAAESACLRVLDHAPRHVPALNLLGQIARQTGRLDLAIRTLERAAAAAPGNPLVQLNLALAQHEAGQLVSAAESYRRAIVLDPARADGHLGLGKVLRALGRNSEAIAALEQAVRNDPGNHKALNFLGAMLLAAARWADAEQVSRAAVRLRTDYMAAHNNLGMALERQGRLPEALACYDRALELDEHCLQAANNLAGVLSRLGQDAAADLVLKSAVGLRAAG